MKFKFFDTVNNKFIHEITEGLYDYNLAVESNCSIIGVCWRSDCCDPCIDLDSKGIIVCRYTEVCDYQGTEIYEGDSVELYERDLDSDSVKTRVWIVKMRMGNWTINFRDESQDLFRAAPQLKVVSS